MHIEVRGQGAPLVLLHGWAMHGGVFAPLAERLSDHFELHLVDLPGHGRSRDSGVPLEPDATVDAIAARVPAAPWLGWSLGGMFALRAAATRPQAVPALVMLCSVPRFVRGGDAPGGGTRFGMSPEIFAGFADGLRDDYHGTLERFLALEAFGSDDARGELRALRSEVFARGEPPAAALARGLDLLREVDQCALLPHLAVPSLWIAGRRDRVVDPRAMCAASERTPGARFLQIEQGGHAPFLTHADEVADAVASFLARMDAAPRTPSAGGEGGAA